MISRNFLRSFATHSAKLAIVGGGTGGLSVSSQIIRLKILQPKDILIIEPDTIHAYWGYSTMIAGGYCGNTHEEIKKYQKNFYRPIKDIYHPKVNILKQTVKTYYPDKKSLITKEGDIVTYEALVLSPGLASNFDSIEGARQALDDPKSNVASIYDGFGGPAKVNTIRQTLREGKIVFSNALPPAKCAGAPLKTCFLIEDDRRKNKSRDKLDFHFYFSGPILFSVPEYNSVLANIVKKRGINTHFQQILVKINKDKKIAYFKIAQTKEINEVTYEALFFSPHFSAVESIKKSNLVNDIGMIQVDRKTLQHINYANIYALGDATDLPVNKTAGGISVQAPVVVHNLNRYFNNKQPDAHYNGYSICPLFTGNKKMLFTESLFGYPHYSFFTNNLSPKWWYYFLSRYFMPSFYWILMPKGRWYGYRFIFKPKY